MTSYLLRRWEIGIFCAISHPGLTGIILQEGFPTRLPASGGAEVHLLPAAPQATRGDRGGNDRV